MKYFWLLFVTILVGIFAAFITYLATSSEDVVTSWIFWVIDIPLITWANWYFIWRDQDKPKKEFQLKDKYGEYPEERQ